MHIFNIDTIYSRCQYRKEVHSFHTRSKCQVQRHPHDRSVPKDETDPALTHLSGGYKSFLELLNSCVCETLMFSLQLHVTCRERPLVQTTMPSCFSQQRKEMVDPLLDLTPSVMSILLKQIALFCYFSDLKAVSCHAHFGVK